MNSNEARLFVQSGLERRKDDRNEAAREQRLEKYEKDMIHFCNAHCSEAAAVRKMQEAERLKQEALEAHRLAQKEALEQSMAKDEKALDAVKRYIVIFMGLLCLTVFTELPSWAVITMAVGSGFLLAAYIFRVYYPWEEV